MLLLVTSFAQTLQWCLGPGLRSTCPAFNNSRAVAAGRLGSASKKTDCEGFATRFSAFVDFGKRRLAGPFSPCRMEMGGHWLRYLFFCPHLLRPVVYVCRLRFSAGATRRRHTIHKRSAGPWTRPSSSYSIHRLHTAILLGADLLPQMGIQLGIFNSSPFSSSNIFTFAFV